MRLACPSKAKGMYLDTLLSGRSERRLPIAVVVRLKVLDDDGADKQERTYTENLSAHGVCVKSARVWHPGEQAEITPLNEEGPLRGEVVYCQKLDDARFFIGLKFRHNRVSWRALERYDGIGS